MFGQVVICPRPVLSARKSARVIVLVLVAFSFQFIQVSIAPASTTHPLLALVTQQQNPGQQNPEVVTTLEIGKVVERELAGGQKQTYQITLDEGQYASVIVEHRGIDLLVRFLGADGKQIAEFDDELRPQGQEQAEVVAEANGSYKFTVEAKQQNAPVGSYLVRVVEVRPATGKDRSLQEARKLYAESARLWRLGKYDAALIPATAALEARENALGPEDPQVAFALTNLGIINYLKGDLDKSEQFHQRALKIRLKVLGPDHPGVGSCLNNIAELYRLRGEYPAAESLYRRAIESWERSLGPDHAFIALPITNLAIVRRVMGDYVEAELLYQRALTVREKALGPTHIDVGSSLNNLGGLYMVKGDLNKAEDLFQRALEIWEHELGPDHARVATALDNLASIKHDKGDLDKSEGFAKRALATWERALGPEHPSFASSLDHMGTLLRDKGELNEAESLFQRAVAIREKALGPDHPDIAATLNNLAKLYSQTGNFDKAEPLFQRALKIREKALGPDHPGVSEVLANMAAFYAAKRKDDQAISAQARANAILERNIALNLVTGSERQKLAFMTSLSETTDRTISLHTNIAPTSREARALAVTTILQRKGRVQDATSDALGGLRRRFNPQDQKLLDQLNDTTGRLARLVLNGPQKMALAEHQKQIAALEEQKEEIENEISRRSAGFYKRADPITVTAVQSSIPAQAALIEISTYRPFDPKLGWDNKKAYGEPHYVAYVLRHDGEIQWQELGEAKPIDAAIATLRQALRDPRRTDVDQFARAVDQKVMQPLSAMMGDAKQLIVSTDGALNLIPFEALVDERGRYLVERYAFTYLTSGRDLLRMPVARAGQGQPTVVANPSFGEPLTAQMAQAAITQRVSTHGGTRRSVTSARNLSEVYFAPLNGTAQEAVTIRTLFPDVKLLTGAQATEAALKGLAEPLILHVATHGFFLQDTSMDPLANAQLATRSTSANSNGENPLLRSGLALTGANLRTNGVGEDGILTALEASGLNLWGTKLVVLSACDTGLGEVRNGEGVYGLRRAFVIAGAESLVMSLWPVGDYSTRHLMTSYYRNLKLGMGRGAALRQVQLDLLKRNRHLHPFYWANFIQSGEWANLAGRR